MPSPSTQALESLVRVRLLLKEPPGVARIGGAELRRRLTDLVALHDALRSFARHADACESHQLSETEMYGRRWPRPCTCGLDALVDERAILVHLRPREGRAARRDRLQRRNQ